MIDHHSWPNQGDPGDEQPEFHGPDVVANTRREGELLAAARKPYADLIMRLEQEGRAYRDRITELNAIVKEQEEALRRVRVRHVPEFDIRGDIGA